MPGKNITVFFEYLQVEDNKEEFKIKEAVVQQGLLIEIWESLLSKCDVLLPTQSYSKLFPVVMSSKNKSKEGLLEDGDRIVCLDVYIPPKDESAKDVKLPKVKSKKLLKQCVCAIF